MNDSTLLTLLILVIITLLVWILIIDARPKTLSECEKTLPRDQECELIAIPKFRADTL